MAPLTESGEWRAFRIRTGAAIFYVEPTKGATEEI